MKKYFLIIALFFIIERVAAKSTLISFRYHNIGLNFKGGNCDTAILEYFNTIPDTVKLWGCRGEFTQNSTKVKSKYIVFISSEGFAVVSINGELLYLSEVGDFSPSSKKLNIIYKGNGFELELNLHKTKETYLVKHYSGTLTFNYKSQKIIFKIIGRFAC